MKAIATKIGTLIIFVILSTVTLFAQTIAEPPANFHEENAGTKDNPYQIKSLANLKWMSETPEEWGSPIYVGSSDSPEGYLIPANPKFYIQTADIDARETESWEWDHNGRGFRPIGTRPNINSRKYYGFEGEYDGNGYTISNLFMSNVDQYMFYDWFYDIEYLVTFSYENFGLFGEVRNSVIKNVNLMDMRFGARMTSGLLVGYAYKSHIVNCHVSTASDYPVHFVGYNEDPRDRDANLWGGVFGSIAGKVLGGVVEYCTAKATIIDEPLWSNTYIGGLIAWANGEYYPGYEDPWDVIEPEVRYTTVRDCSFSGDIFVSDSFQDLFLALNWKPEDYFEYWIHKGGLFAGVNEYSIIERCFITTEEPMPGAYGVASTVEGTVSSLKSCFWDLESTEVTEAFMSIDDTVVRDNIRGLSTSALKDAQTYINAGFNFEAVWDIDPAINNGFPFINLREVLPLAIPMNLAGSFADDVVSMTWDAPVDNGRGVFDSYNVYRDGVLIDNCEVNQYDETGLADGTYTYYITAVYIVKEALEESLPSEIVEVTVKVEPTMGNEDHVNLAETKIIGNYPNPFNPTTTISFSLKTNGFVNLEIFNIKGQKVKTLVSGEMTSGPHLVVWNGTDESGHGASSGIYFYRLTADRYSETQKMVLMK